jgi:hypothetical protein
MTRLRSRPSAATLPSSRWKTIRDRRKQRAQRQFCTSACYRDHRFGIDIRRCVFLRFDFVIDCTTD